MFYRLIQNSPKLNTTQMSNKKWMNKQLTLYLYSGKLLSIVREQTIASSNNMDEIKNHSKRKKWETNKLHCIIQYI